MHGPSAYDNDNGSHCQFNLYNSTFYHPDTADPLGSVGLEKILYSQDVGYSPATDARNFPATLIHGPFATQVEDGGFPRTHHTRTTSGRLSIIPDPPAKPAFPLNTLESSREGVRAPHLPVFEYGPMASRANTGADDLLDPFSIESAQPAVGSGMRSRAASQQKERRASDRDEYQNAASAPIQAGVGMGYGHRGVYHTPAALLDPPAQPCTFPDPTSSRAVGVTRTTRPSRRASHRYEESAFDRPGKKVAAENEPDPGKLRSLCQQRGGKDFAVAWITEIFVDGVAVDALMRPLTILEVDAMSLRLPGFKPAQGYDGFLEIINKRFACGLCPDDNRMHWKNKKDAVPHLRKFHFGLANRCIDCCKLVYSTGQMNSHRCRTRKAFTTRLSAVESNQGGPNLA